MLVPDSNDEAKPVHPTFVAMIKWLRYSQRVAQTAGWFDVGTGGDGREEARALG